jgi:hypothetical protein
MHRNCGGERQAAEFGGRESEEWSLAVVVWRKTEGEREEGRKGA